MSVWIDPPAWPAHGRLFSHVVSDHDYDELHAVADRAGIPRRAFDGDHYDVASERYADLVRAGARETSGADLLRRLNASGLRLRKRKGDRGLARLFQQHTPFGPATLDMVGSRRPVPDPTLVALLVPDPDPWGVAWTHLAGRTPEAALRELDRAACARAREVGWLRVSPEQHAGDGRDREMVQVFATEPPFATLPNPWNFYTEDI